MRASTSDELVRLILPRPLSLEQTLEFIARTSASRSPRRASACARLSSPPESVRRSPRGENASAIRSRPLADRVANGGRRTPGDAPGRATFRARSSSSASPSPASPCLQPPHAPSASSSAPQPPRPSSSDCLRQANAAGRIGKPRHRIERHSRVTAILITVHARRGRGRARGPRFRPSSRSSRAPPARRSSSLHHHPSQAATHGRPGPARCGRAGARSRAGSRFDSPRLGR